MPFLERWILHEICYNCINNVLALNIERSVKKIPPVTENPFEICSTKYFHFEVTCNTLSRDFKLDSFLFNLQSSEIQNHTFII